MPDQPLTIDEAITALDVSDKTVRRMLKDGLLHEQARDERGRILITAASVRAAAEQLALRRNDPGRAQELILASQTELLNQTITRYTGMLEDRDTMIWRLTAEVTELRTRHEYMVDRDQVTERDRRIAELKAEIALVRQQAPTEPAQADKPGWWAWLRGK